MNLLMNFNAKIYQFSRHAKNIQIVYRCFRILLKYGHCMHFIKLKHILESLTNCPARELVKRRQIIQSLDANSDFRGVYKYAKCLFKFKAI